MLCIQCRISIQALCRTFSAAAIAVLFTVSSRQASGETAVPFTEASILSGLLFIDGVYIEPPYRIESDGESIRINGLAYAKHHFDLSCYETFSPIRARVSDDMQLVGSTLAEMTLPELSTFAKDVASDLGCGDIVMLCSGKRPVFLHRAREGQDLLTVLVQKHSNPEQAIANAEKVLACMDPAYWRDFVSDFQPTSRFVDHARNVVNHTRKVQTTNEQVSRSRIWIERVGYPLNMFAIVAVVLAFGHLISNGPNAVVDPQDPESLDTTRRTITCSLAFVGLLSAMDLVWTLIAHQTGTMRELNPLGYQIIDDPVKLIVFKLSVTSASVGLLYWLQEHAFARRAAWWCCLVLTLLTARWVTFQSMFL